MSSSWSAIWDTLTFWIPSDPRLPTGEGPVGPPRIGRGAEISCNAPGARMSISGMPKHCLATRHTKPTWIDSTTVNSRFPTTWPSASSKSIRKSLIAVAMTSAGAWLRIRMVGQEPILRLNASQTGCAKFAQVTMSESWVRRTKAAGSGNTELIENEEQPENWHQGLRVHRQCVSLGLWPQRFANSNWKVATQRSHLKERWWTVATPTLQVWNLTGKTHLEPKWHECQIDSSTSQLIWFVPPMHLLSWFSFQQFLFQLKRMDTNGSNWDWKKSRQPATLPPKFKAPRTPRKSTVLDNKVRKNSRSPQANLKESIQDLHVDGCLDTLQGSNKSHLWEQENHLYELNHMQHAPWTIHETSVRRTFQRCWDDPLVAFCWPNKKCILKSSALQKNLEAKGFTPKLHQVPSRRFKPIRITPPPSSITLNNARRRWAFLQISGWWFQGTE